MTEVRYTRAVGYKFYEDGSVHPFAGNTVICFAAPTSHAYQQAEWVQSEFRKLPIASKFVLLPPSSFHMTVCELVNDVYRHPNKFPVNLPLDTPLEEVDQFFIERIPSLPTPSNFRMRCTGVEGGGLSIRLAPADNETHEAIWAYRRAVVDATGLHLPDFDTYRFHMTLAYQIIELEPEEALIETQFLETMSAHLRENFGIFDTGAPVLTFFDDMFAFVPMAERLTLRSRQTDYTEQLTATSP
jgi:hypothetical protein